MHSLDVCKKYCSLLCLMISYLKSLPSLLGHITLKDMLLAITVHVSQNET